MRVSSLAIFAIVAASPVLAGCQSIFGTSRGVRTDISIPEQADPAVYAASQMAAGRAALRDGQFGLAIIAFRNARRAPEHTAAASNGLAIAYAQIGRPDLAERYFKQAIAEAPDVQSYHANLTRFYASVPASPTRMATAKAIESSRRSSQEPTVQFLPGSAERSAIRVEQPVHQLIRVSAKEVQIGTQTNPRRRTLDSQDAPLKARRTNPAYPVRIELGERGQPVHVNNSARQYPIRVSLAPSD